MALVRSAVLFLAALPCADAGTCKSELSLIQTQSEKLTVQGDLQRRATASRLKTITESASSAASHIRSFLSEPGNVGKALSQGLRAVHSAMPMLTVDPPRIEEGFSTFSSQLLSAIELMIPDSMRGEE